MKISPSILTCDFNNLKNEIDTVLEHLDLLHLDVMDGKFVPAKTFDYKLVSEIRSQFDIIFDVHLMIEKPCEYIEKYALAGSDIITFHYESKSDVLHTINLIKKFNKKIGLSINPKTPVDAIISYLKLVDLVLVMSVEPGRGGQAFDDTSLEKIKFLKKFKNDNNLSYEIEVDGGINLSTINLVKEAGADIVVSGSYIFNSDDRVNKIKSLK